MEWPLAMALAFLCGSIPFGLLIARAKGIDIRQHGSGNIGATNVARVLGMRLGLLCFGLDVLKGLGPTLGAGLAMDVAGRLAIAPSQSWWWLGVMSAAIAGHMFSPWIGFRGGKGVATGLGALLGVFPALSIPALGALLIWIATVWKWRYVSVSSCAAALSLPALVAATFAAGGEWGSSLPFLVVTGVLAAVVTWKHRSNLKRVFAGNENKLGQRAAPADR